jgi:hypothetical protein
LQDRKTYGTSKHFPEKIIPQKVAPKYGVFTKGDPLHVGHNKLIGGNYPYVEDPLIDHVPFRKNVKKPIWRDPTHMQTSAQNTVTNNFRNINYEKSTTLN